MSVLNTYKRIRAELKYDEGLIEHIGQASSAVQRYLFSEAKRQISDIDSVYFSGDIPIICFKRLSDFDEDRVKKLHKRIWNQNRVPLLYVITPGELRIYNCFKEPARPESKYKLDAQDRLIKHFKMATSILEELEEFSKSRIDSGAFWKSQQGQHFSPKNRVDYKLLERLRKVRKVLRKKGLEYSTIHRLLGCSIFILYLEDRNIISNEYYSQFLSDAETYLDVLKNVKATFKLLEKLEYKFNGDLFPVKDIENKGVKQVHLDE